jgi:hypothetical protein
MAGSITAKDVIGMRPQQTVANTAAFNNGKYSLSKGQLRKTQRSLLYFLVKSLPLVGECITKIQ